MSRVDRSRAAARDLRGLWWYIAGDDLEAADRLLLRLDDKAQFLAGAPLAGSARPELGQDLRSFAVGNYLLFYRPSPDGIRLVRVLHASRDVSRAFRR